MLASMAYYLGDRALFCNVIGEDNANLLSAGVSLPGFVYSSKTTPDWIVLFGLSVDLKHTAEHLERLDLTRYKVHSFPIPGPDVSRPELFARSFRPIRSFKHDEGLFILERVR